jgi:MoxR-like ATPase
MLPADVIGTQIYNPQSGGFSTRKGPIFANLILADEINRAPAKVQSALLEAMQEKQVTIGDQTFPSKNRSSCSPPRTPSNRKAPTRCPKPRSTASCSSSRSATPPAEERQILELMARTSGRPPPPRRRDPQQILNAREVINDIYVDDKVKDYIVDLVCATRDPAAYKIDLQGLIQLGASPRATIALTLCAKAHAFLRGRGYVTPQDVKSIAMDVLRHRVAITYEAEAEDKTSETIIQKILDELPVP